MKRSAGILAYRRDADGLRVLLVHPGGPFWQKRDIGAWSIPKGELAPGDDAEATARREFHEELGIVPEGRLHLLGEVLQAGGKHVTAFALEGDFAVDTLSSNTFEMEWPPRSGRIASFPEVDRASWFMIAEAREKIIAGQLPLLDLIEAFARGAPQKNR